MRPRMPERPHLIIALLILISALLVTVWPVASFASVPRPLNDDHLLSKAVEVFPTAPTPTSQPTTIPTAQPTSIPTLPASVPTSPPKPTATPPPPATVENSSHANSNGRSAQPHSRSGHSDTAAHLGPSAHGCSHRGTAPYPPAHGCTNGSTHGCAGGSDTASPRRPSNEDQVAEDAALAMINESRAQNGLPPLAMYEPLRQVARSHAQDMATRDYFSHSSPEGVGPFDRMRNAGIGFGYAAENIAYRSGAGNPTANVRGSHEAMMAETPPNDGHRRANSKPLSQAGGNRRDHRAQRQDLLRG